MTHTPGPWVYVQDDCGGEFFGCGVAQHKGAPEFIWFDACDDVETDIATAHLVAAAPDLLEALEMADAALSGANMDMKAVERKARAAIAKAKGQTNE